MQGQPEDDKSRKAAKQMLNNLGGSSNQQRTERKLEN